jgi:hypothetical protein
MDVANVENAGAFFHKRKYPKKKRPYAACFLRSSILPGIAGRDLLSLRQCAASLPHLFGLFPAKSAVLGAAQGNSLSYCVTSVI